MIQLIPVCSGCDAKAIRRWTRDRSRWFWTCPDWPRCQGRIQVEDVSRELKQHANWGIRAAGLANRDVRFLHHFTDIANLPLVFDHGGLLSWDEQGRRGFRAPKPGGTEDSRRLAATNGDLDRISTSVSSNIPMLAVRMRDGSRTAIIVLNPAVADLPGVLFTSTNATAAGHWRAEPPRGFGAINFPVATGPVEWADPEWKKAVQAEILVPVAVTIDHFVAVVFRTADDLETVRQSGSAPPGLDLVVEPDLFPQVW